MDVAAWRLSNAVRMSAMALSLPPKESKTPSASGMLYRSKNIDHHLSTLSLNHQLFPHQQAFPLRRTYIKWFGTSRQYTGPLYRTNSRLLRPQSVAPRLDLCQLTIYTKRPPKWRGPGSFVFTVPANPAFRSISCTSPASRRETVAYPLWLPSPSHIALRRIRA